MFIDDAVIEQKTRISSFITEEIADKLFSLKLPYLLSLPANPLFNKYVSQKGVNPVDVMAIAKNYVLPGKLQISRVVRETISKELLAGLFDVYNLDFEKITSKGEQVEFLANEILDKKLVEGIFESEKQLIDSGIVSSRKDISRYVNRLKKHFNPGARKSDKILWVENATPKKGRLLPLYEVDLNLARVYSRKNNDVLYVQEKGKSLLSAKSKILRVAHKEGYPLINLDGKTDLEIFKEWYKIQSKISKQIKDFNGIMIVGQSEPFGSPESTLNYISSNIDKLPLVDVLDFKNYYSRKVRKEEKKDIFAHHYTVALNRRNFFPSTVIDKLPLESRIVLAHTRNDFYDPISLHVKSFRNEIEDIFGERAHNLYKHKSLLAAYKSGLNTSELKKFEALEDLFQKSLLPDSIPKYLQK